MIKKYVGICKIDAKILNSLLENARKSYSKIARELKISKEVVRYRIKNLEKKGIIRAYKTLINYSYINAAVYEILIRLKFDIKKESEDFMELIKNPRVLGYANCMGEYNYKIIVHTENIDELKEITNKIKDVFSKSLDYMNVLSFVDENYVYNPKCLKQKKKAEITKSEKEMLKILINNANISVKDLSKKLKKSYPSIVKSIRRLKKSEIIKAFYPDINFRQIGLRGYSAYISTQHLTDEQEKKIIEFFVNDNDIFWYVRYVGEFDFGIEIVVETVHEFKEKIESLTEKFQDKIVEIRTVRYLSNKA